MLTQSKTHPSKFWIILVLIPFICFSFKDSQQSKGELIVKGITLNEAGKTVASVVKLYDENHELIEEQITSKNGKFTIRLPLEQILFMTVSSDEVASKVICFDTDVPMSKMNKRYEFRCEFKLFALEGIPNHENLNEPLGKVKYKASGFGYDVSFTRQENEKFKEFLTERKALQVRKG